MARGLLGATMYIESLVPELNWSPEQQKSVKSYSENFKSFKFPAKKRKSQNQEEENERSEGQPMRKKPKTSESLDDELETSTRLLVEFAGFQEIDESALDKLKNVFHNRLITMARQMSAAERRRKDGLEMPFKSPLEWTLKLNGIRKVIEIKEWYDVTYRERYRQLKEQLRNDERLTISMKR